MKTNRIGADSIRCSYISLNDRWAGILEYHFKFIFEQESLPLLFKKIKGELQTYAKNANVFL